jgi:pre-mRNA-splicing factor CWC26
VHRDQSGRVIDVAELRDRAIREQQDERAREAERKTWTEGLVQREQREKRAQEEAKMSRVDVTR